MPEGAGRPTGKAAVERTAVNPRPVDNASGARTVPATLYLSAVRVLPGAVVNVAASAHPAPQLRGIAPDHASEPGELVRFRAGLDLPKSADRVLLRIAAAQRYRLKVNGAGVGIAYTSWYAETYNVTGLLKARGNEVKVAVSGEPVPEEQPR
ncbi:MAG: hypothetical protein AB7W28_11280 [Armatimonadota bacterium]